MSPVLKRRGKLGNLYEHVEQFCSGTRELLLEEYGFMDKKSETFGFQSHDTVWIAKGALDYFDDESQMLAFAGDKIMEYWNIKFQYFNHLCWLMENGKEVSKKEWKDLWSELIRLQGGFHDIPALQENAKLLYTSINIKKFQ